MVFTKANTNDVYVGLSTGTTFTGGAKWTTSSACPAKPPSEGGRER